MHLCSPDWHKWDIDASRMDSIKSTNISYMCRGNRGRILQLMGKPIGDLSSDYGTLSLWEAIETVREMKLANVITESDPKVVILSITGKIVAPKQISNLVDAIRSISRNNNDTRFSYSNRTCNTPCWWSSKRGLVFV